MRYGFFTMPHHPRVKHWSTALKEDREAIVTADRLGFSEALIGEHVSDPFETITSSLIFVASLGAVTSDIRLGTCTINMPNSHPAAVASNVAMVDQILEGRFIFGVGPGALATDAEIFGTLDSNRNEMFLEGIEQVLQIWKGEPPYNIRGNYWSISTERTYDKETAGGTLPKPYQVPHPEILCTALSKNSASLEYAARRGWSVISSNFLHDSGLVNHGRIYFNNQRDQKLSPDGKAWRVARMIFVSEDEAVLERYAKSLDGPYGQCIEHVLKKLRTGKRLSVLKENSDQSDSEITVDYLLDQLVIAGTPSAVSEKILSLKEEVGEFGTLAYIGVDWADRELALCSMDLFANRVMNEVNVALK